MENDRNRVDQASFTSIVLLARLELVCEGAVTLDAQNVRASRERPPRTASDAAPTSSGAWRYQSCRAAKRSGCAIARWSSPRRARSRSCIVCWD